MKKRVWKFYIKTFPSIFLGVQLSPLAEPLMRSQLLHVHDQWVEISRAINMALIGSDLEEHKSLRKINL